MNRTLKRYHPTTIRYACSHEVTEDRGPMSDQLRANILAECAGRLCPECRSRLLAEERACEDRQRENLARAEADRMLWSE